MNREWIRRPEPEKPRVEELESKNPSVMGAYLEANPGCLSQLPAKEALAWLDLWGPLPRRATEHRPLTEEWLWSGNPVEGD